MVVPGIGIRGKRSQNTDPSKVSKFVPHIRHIENRGTGRVSESWNQESKVMENRLTMILFECEHTIPTFPYYETKDKKKMKKFSDSRRFWRYYTESGNCIFCTHIVGSGWQTRYVRTRSNNREQRMRMNPELLRTKLARKLRQNEIRYTEVTARCLYREARNYFEEIYTSSRKMLFKKINPRGIRHFSMLRSARLLSDTQEARTMSRIRSKNSRQQSLFALLAFQLHILNIRRYIRER